MQHRRRHLRLGRHPDPLARHRLPRRGAGAGRTRWSDADGDAPHVHVDAAAARQPGDLGPQPRPPASSTVADLFDEAGLAHDPELLTRTTGSSGSRTPRPTRRWRRCSPTLRERGHPGRGAVQHDLAAGVARGLLPPRRRARPDRRRRLHQRDPVDQALAARRSRRRWTAVGATDPARCVYVGDRLYDDVWGAQNAGLRAIHVPAQRDPGRAGRPHRGRARRRGPRARRAPRAARRRRSDATSPRAVVRRASRTCIPPNIDVCRGETSRPAPVAASGHPRRATTPVPAHPAAPVPGRGPRPPLDAARRRGRRPRAAAPRHGGAGRRERRSAPARDRVRAVLAARRRPHRGAATSGPGPTRCCGGGCPTATTAPVAVVRSGDVVTLDTISHEGLLEDQGKDPPPVLRAVRRRRARGAPRRRRRGRARRRTTGPAPTW